MVIDINNINPSQPGKRNGGADSNALDKSNVNNEPAAQNTSADTAQDTVELSAQAQNLNRIREALSNLPDVDDARVEQIRQQIADGRYTINTDQIAERILLDDQNF